MYHNSDIYPCLFTFTLLFSTIIKVRVYVSRIQFPLAWSFPTCSVAPSCRTLCDPMNCSTPGFCVLHRLPEFAQVYVHWVGDAVQPAHHLIFRCPLLLCLQSFWLENQMKPWNCGLLSKKCFVCCSGPGSSILGHSAASRQSVLASVICLCGNQVLLLGGPGHVAYRVPPAWCLYHRRMSRSQSGIGSGASFMWQILYKYLLKWNNFS